MKRLLCACCCLLPAWIVLAAPAPAPSLKGWGRPVDPDQDCKIRYDGDAISIDMPGKDHDYDLDRKKINAPRFLRDIDRDFDLRVRVQIDCRHSDQSTAKDKPSLVSAGLLLLFPETNRPVCSRMEYGMAQKGLGLNAFDDRMSLVYLHDKGDKPPKGIGEDGYISSKLWFSNGGLKPDMTWNREVLGHSHVLLDRRWEKWPLPKKPGPAYLRLEVKGGNFYFYISSDGGNWVLANRSAMQPPIKVGLAAYTSSTKPSKVRFDQIKFTQGKKKAK